ncbi:MULTISPECIES: hypothetical protein [unclassified Tardiphaga]|nr:MULTISPECIES: hypothetical protein [unclassified Tardiphaga]
MTTPLHIGLLLFPNLTQLDLTGPKSWGWSRRGWQSGLGAAMR